MSKAPSQAGGRPGLGGGRRLRDHGCLTDNDGEVEGRGEREWKRERCRDLKLHSLLHLAFPNLYVTINIKAHNLNQSHLSFLLEPPTPSFLKRRIQTSLEVFMYLRLASASQVGVGWLQACIDRALSSYLVLQLCTPTQLNWLLLRDGDSVSKY